MSDPAALQDNNENFDNMTVAEFEARLPDLFATGDGIVSNNPRFATFLGKNPDCAALVKDLETIAEHAKSLFDEPSDEPSDAVWSNIARTLKDEAAGTTNEN